MCRECPYELCEFVIVVLFILFFISFASLFRCFLFSRLLCFCHFTFAFLFSLIFSSISCGIIFVCLLVGSGVSGCPCCFLNSSCQCCYCLFDVFRSFQWDVAVYFALSLKVCHLVVLLHSVSGLLQSIGFFCIQLLWVYDRSYARGLVLFLV